MIKIIQSEFYRIRKSRLFFYCLLLSAFFMLSLALTFHYDTVKVPTKMNIQATVSLNKFTEFLFSDYSLIFPLTLFLGLYFTEDYHRGTYAILLSKGISRTSLFYGKLVASWIGTLLYTIVSFLVAYLFILSLWIKQPQIEYSIPLIIGYLLLQILCFLGYTTFICLISCLFRFRAIVIVINFCLLGTLYLYLTKISTALDLNYSLYQYWIVGLSHKMKINLYIYQLPKILLTITSYIFIPATLSFLLYQKSDLRKLERR
ncbi:ABC transporter permease [Clostridioides sp. ZZV15-6598]|uniref:ABC transporter permease n=1 Tax=Clostridioides sp. ZZV15-6598 TaxID=2811501 RepID=UPI001D12E728|nr:ABC transporter permease [Clostridioides sp. ZZV15-6598]